MLTRNSFLFLGIGALLFTVISADAQKSHEAKPKIKPPVLQPKTEPVEAMTLDNTGSTNTFGYEICVNPNGKANISEPIDEKSGVIGWHLSQTGGPSLSADLTHKVFADLDAAMPLTSLSVRHGMRSVSFGTRTYITYKGQKSPDLTFGGDERTNALKADIEAITQALHVTNAPRRPLLMRPITP